MAVMHSSSGVSHHRQPALWHEVARLQWHLDARFASADHPASPRKVRACHPRATPNGNSCPSESSSVCREKARKRPGSAESCGSGPLSRPIRARRDLELLEVPVLVKGGLVRADDVRRERPEERPQASSEFNDGSPRFLGAASDLRSATSQLATQNSPSAMPRRRYRSVTASLLTRYLTHTPPRD